MKQKLTYADFVAAEKLKQQGHKEGTLAWFINRQFELGKKFTDAHAYIRWRIRGHWIAELRPQDIKKAHLEKYARDLAAGVLPSKARKPVLPKPQTVRGYIVTIAAVVNYFVAREELPPECSVVYKGAIKWLRGEKMIGDSPIRKRRPKVEENSALSQLFHERESRRGVVYGRPHRSGDIPMSIMQTWQLASLMRVGNSCGILWEDWEREQSTILIRKIKAQLHPKLIALTPHAQRILEVLWPLRDQSEPRIFPYRSQSVSAAYTQAKKELDIKNLHLHDSRGDGCTRIVEEGGLSVDEGCQFSGHADPSMYRQRYLSLRPENVARKLALKAA